MTLETGYDYPAAAARLREAGYPVTERWLRNHIKELPHTKIGYEVRFTDAQLAELVADRSRTPAAQESLKPVSRRRSA